MNSLWKVIALEDETFFDLDECQNIYVFNNFTTMTVIFKIERIFGNLFHMDST